MGDKGHLVTESKVPSLRGEDWLIERRVKSGLSEYSYYVIDPEASEEMRKSAEPYRFSWAHWERLSQLDIDHGLAVCIEILHCKVWKGRGRLVLSDGQVTAIRDRLGNLQWSALQEEMAELSRHEDGREDYLMTTVWADLFEETLGEEWLAAQALHALNVSDNAFAFGYLVCEIDQKRRNERTFVRGNQVQKGSSAGGKARARSLAPKTVSVLAAMRKAMDARKLSALSAADFVARNGTGKSKAANYRLWTKYAKKLGLCPPKSQ